MNKKDNEFEYIYRIIGKINMFLHEMIEKRKRMK